MARTRVQKNIYFDDVKRKYYVNMNFGYDENGKQIKKTKTFSSISDARKALKNYNEEKIKETLKKKKKMTLKEWLEDWMKNIIIPNREKTTAYGYWQVINNHLSPELGSIKIQDLKTLFQEMLK